MNLPTAPIPQQCVPLLSYEASSVVAIITSVLCLLYAVFNWTQVRKVDLVVEHEQEQGQQQLMENMPLQKRNLLLQLGFKVTDSTFQFMKYQYIASLVLVIISFLLIAFLSQLQFNTAVAFIVGAIVEVISGLVGVLVSIKSLNRVVYCSRFGLGPAFRVAMQASSACGFFGSSLSLLTLTVMIQIYKQDYSLTQYDMKLSYFRLLFQSIAGYGLGASSIALFARVGGGMYESAAQSGSQMVGNIQNSLAENHPKNAATIIGVSSNLVGMGGGGLSDSLGSSIQITCICFLVIFDNLIGNGKCGISLANLMLPIMILTFGHVTALIGSIYSNMIAWPDSQQRILKSLYIQRVIVWIFMIIFIFLAAYLCLPESFVLLGILQNSFGFFNACICGWIGITVWIVVSFFTQFVTSSQFKPVLALIQASMSGSAAHVTLGLALGYFSTIVPGILVSLAVYISHQQLGIFGIAFCALCGISIIPLISSLSIFGPLCIKSQKFAHLASLQQTQKQNCKFLAHNGRVVAAVDKGASIISASIVGVSLLGAYLKNAALNSSKISLVNPQIFTGLLIGSVFPFIVSSLAMRGSRKGGKNIKRQIQRQFLQNPAVERGQQQPQYSYCVREIAISVVFYIVFILILVVVIPLVIGFGLGPKFIAGLLPGIIVSSLQFSQSSAVSGQAWRSIKTSIQQGTVTDEDGNVQGIGSNAYKAATISNSIGVGLRGCAGSSLTSTVKLVGMLSVIFASKFTQLHK